jgi:hypothetical protein
MYIIRRRRKKMATVDTNHPSEYSPLAAFGFALHRWWLIAIFVLVGGLIGWGFSRLHAPLYDAQALLVITIDYQQAPELVQKTDDHYLEDQIMGAANAVVISTVVLDQVYADLQASGISLDWEKYTRNLASERKRSQFWLRVRDSDPQRAALVANLWVEKAYAALVDFHQHAVTARVLRDYLAGMAACPPPPETKPQMPSLCGNGAAEIQQAIATVTAQMQAETTAGNALSPALTFSLERKAAVPDTPVAYRASLLLSTGALLGAVVGILVLPIVSLRRPFSAKNKLG